MLPEPPTSPDPPMLPESSETEDDSEYNLSPEGYHFPLYPKTSPFYGQPLPGCRIVRRGDPDHGIKLPTTPRAPIRADATDKDERDESTTPRAPIRVDATDKNERLEPTTPRAIELPNPTGPPPAKNPDAQKRRHRIMGHLRSLKNTMKRLQQDQKKYHRSLGEDRSEHPATIAVCRAIKDTSRAIVSLDYVSKKAFEDAE